MPFDVCHRCGGRVLLSALEGPEFSVEAGPVASQRFRREAVEKLRMAARGVDAARAGRALRAHRVRVVEGLSRETAEDLRDALGPRETAAAVAEGPTPPVGWGGALDKGLPVWGLAAGAALGLAVHPVGWVLGALAAAALAYRNARRPMPVLGTAPVGPLVDPTLREAVLGYVQAKDAVADAAARAALETTADAVVAGAAALADPDAVEPFGDLSGTMSAQLARAFEQLAGVARRGMVGPEERAALARIPAEAGVPEDALGAPAEAPLGLEDPLSEAIGALGARDA